MQTNNETMHQSTVIIIIIHTKKNLHTLKHFYRKEILLNHIMLNNGTRNESWEQMSQPLYIYNILIKIAEVQ